MMDDEDEILEQLKEATIECPECQHIEDEQYTCTTCWSQGGNGRLSVFEYLKEHRSLLDA
tara:strand:- start:794 stop:973 length:180 start_codon:yes stop_codon:yes gene_type:complete